MEYNHIVPEQTPYRGLPLDIRTTNIKFQYFAGGKKLYQLVNSSRIYIMVIVVFLTLFHQFSSLHVFQVNFLSTWEL